MNENVVSGIIILYINTYIAQGNRTALHFVAEEGHTAAIETLIKAGADVKALAKVSIGICMHLYMCMGHVYAYYIYIYIHACICIYVYICIYI